MVNGKNAHESDGALKDVLIDVIFYAIISLAATLITYYAALPVAGANNAFYAALTVLLATAVAAPLANRISSSSSG